MAESRSSVEVHWIDPPFRGIFPLQGFHISRSLKRVLRQKDYTFRINTDFVGTMAGCANRNETWINDAICTTFLDLHEKGHAHSVEVWSGDDMIGGLYGLAIGSAFFGESMFSRQPDASKIALSWLIHRLRHGGFTLFDTQFVTPHLLSLGAIEISKQDYLARLSQAIGTSATFMPDGYHPTRDEIAFQFSQDKTQTS